MKLLPDNPSLDHLRQQAKDLLAGLKESVPATTLADAQRSLAEQYGFRTWPDMKTEVDQRRGHTDVASPELAIELAQTFDLGSPIEPMRSVSADDMGRAWSMTTDRGRWAVRTMDTWYPIVDADTDVQLQKAALAAGVTLPIPQVSRSGAIVEEVGGHRWRACEWRHSGPPLAAPVDAATTRKVGQTLATIHALAIPIDRISPWHAARLVPEPWQEVAQRATTAQASWVVDLKERIPDLLELDVIGAVPEQSAPVLCHNTLGPGVVRRGSAGELVVLSWEHAGGQPTGWELCDALVHWTNDPNGGINRAAALAMVDGYRTVTGTLPPIGIDSFHGAAISLVNYLNGLIGDALNEPAEERRALANRSVHHLLTHMPTRSTFEQILEAVG